MTTGSGSVVGLGRVVFGSPALGALRTSPAAQEAQEAQEATARAAPAR